ncbi:protein of unknown function [Candidatus Hydrogenisulfobacillus filiaventi]|uniref:Uncharacterized protein n=1 Tax=Candidatus Hydrogenisulfobacillus filiaventi TaxID=2707344 RepID=A0A6F8ZD83_9FIRM|nr:hypothetical protein [Bacillota bacterium]CAB1127569.1 protein of unknown function [Candidatus Hydrogenisulfobacillus filiaventi]
MRKVLTHECQSETRSASLRELADRGVIRPIPPDQALAGSRRLQERLPRVFDALRRL